MEDNKNTQPVSDPGKRQEQDRTKNSSLGQNPGLKDENVANKGEKKAIEETSEDRLDSAE